MITYTMTATCDGCGITLFRDHPKVTHLASVRWRMEERLKKEGGMVRLQYRKASLLYCAACADGPAGVKKRAVEILREREEPGLL